MGMVHIEGEVIIKRPVETVFDFLADERNEPRYNPSMLRAEKISDCPIGLGTRFKAETAGRGKPVEMTLEITAYDRPRLLSSSTHMSMMDVDGTLTLDAADGGTRMQWSWNVKPHGFFKLMTPLIRITGERQEQRIWKSLKQYLEAQGNS